MTANKFRKEDIVISDDTNIWGVPVGRIVGKVKKIINEERMDVLVLEGGENVKTALTDCDYPFPIKDFRLKFEGKIFIFKKKNEKSGKRIREL